MTGTATDAGSAITIEDYGVPIATTTAGAAPTPAPWSVNVNLVNGLHDLTAVEVLAGTNGQQTSGPSADDFVQVSGADQLITNGSFADPPVPSDSYGNYSTIAGWSPTNDCGIEVQDSEYGTGYDGAEYAELASNCVSGVAQTVDTVPGTQYQVSFAYEARPDHDPDYPSCASEENSFSVEWGQTYLAGDGGAGDPDPGSDLTGKPGPDAWTVANYTVTAASDTTVLQFNDTNPCAGDSYGDFLDDVSVVPVASLEPSNTTWVTAEDISLSPETVGSTTEYTGAPDPEQSLAFAGEGLWYDFSIAPGEQVQVALSSLPADYRIDLFSDISHTFKSETSATPDLAALGAEASASAFSASAFSASAFSASAFSASAFSASAFSASAFSASAFSASAFSASAFSASAFSASAFSTAYSDAQVNSLVAESTEPGAVDKSVTADTWNDTGNFYVYVSADNGAYSSLPFDLTVTTSGSSCGATLDTNTTPTLSGAGTSYSTVIVENSTAMDSHYSRAGAILDGTNGALAALATAPGVNGVVVDVAQDPTVTALQSQATDNPSCPYAENLVAEAIQNIINSYRTGTNNLKYVVLVGDDDIIPFFRYPDNAGLAPESEYVPPLLSTSPANAALQDDYYLTDDPYGAASELSVQGAPVSLPTAAVGRLVETPQDIAGTIQSYIAKQTLTPSNALATGYDFMSAPAGQVAQAFAAGLGGTNVDTSLETGTWSATSLMTDLSSNAHGLVFLGAHFSANNLLAGDDTTTLTTNTFAQDIGSQLESSLVLSPGCHSGYNIDAADGIPGVTDDLAWPQAFTEAGATLIAGTGYQYGDSNYVAYSDQVYVDLAQLLSYGPVNVGTALLEAKQQYLSTLFQLNGLEVKALQQITLYGLPMLGVEETSAVNGPNAPTSIVGPNVVAAVASGPGQALGLEEADLSYQTPQSPAIGKVTVPSTPYSYYSYATDPQLTAVPGGPVLPVQTEDVNVAGETLRGVGFVGGSYADTPGTNPLTGDPAVDTSNAIVPFSSPTFFPQTNWNPNYYSTLVNNGDTELAITPLQYESDPDGATTATQRMYSNLDLRLFYDNDVTSVGGGTPALAAAPQISNVSSTATGDVVNVTADVSGDVSAGTQDVWVTYTGTPGAPLYGAWSSVDLTQAAPGVWTGSYTDPGGTPATGSVFMVQAVNGVGEVSLDNNDGYYFTPTFTPGAQPPAGATTNTYTLQLSTSGGSAAYGTTTSVSATLVPSPNDPSANVDGDVVTFGLGGTTVTGVTVSSGTVTVNIPITNAPGPYELTASYAGGGNNQPAGTQTSFQVTQAPTSLELSAPAQITSGAASGVSATLTSTGEAPLPQKPVYFLVSNGTSVVASSVGTTNASGVAQAGAIIVPPGDVGTGYSITASFAPSSVPVPGTQITYNASDPDYVSSSSTTMQVTVVGPTQTALAFAPGSPVFGQPVGLTAVVSSINSYGTVEVPGGDGTVAFYENGSSTPISGCGGAQLQSGQATCTVSGLGLGLATFSASYSGYASNYLPSSSVSTQVVVGTAETTTTVSGYGTSVSGQAVDFVATVAPTMGSGVPTGKVEFFETPGNSTQTPVTGCTSVSLNLGSPDTASCPATGPAAAGSPYAISAEYLGDGNFTTSTSAPVTQYVSPASTSTTVNSSGSASVVGQSVTYTATVSVKAPGSATPTGNVEFFDGTAPIGGCGGASGYQLSGSTAMCSVMYTSTGGHSITAEYLGDANTSASTSSPITQTVNADPTTLVLTSSSGGSSSGPRAGLSVAGQTIIYTATVSANSPGSGIPGGTVSFSYVPKGGSPISLCPNLTPTSGTVSCNDNGLFLTTGSPYTVMASFTPLAGYLASSASVAEDVEAASTTTALSVPASTKFGLSVTLTATVKPVAPGTGTPTGTVSFYDGTGLIGTAPLSSGAATITVSGLPGATQALSASYPGNAEFVGSIGTASTSTTFTQTISGTDSGSLSIASGQLVFVTGKVTGAVSVGPGGGLEVDGGSIGGAVSASGAVELVLCGAKVGGAMSVSSSTGYVTIGGGTLCGPSSVAGAVSFSGNKAGLQVAGSSIGGAASVSGNSGSGTDLVDDTIGGAASVSGNSGSATDLVGDQIGGALSVTGNTSSSTEVSANTIGGALACSSNVPPPTDAGEANKAAVKSGQCAGATF